jgi:hypothetical protein
VPAASAALQLGLQMSKQVGVGKLARRAARQADEFSSEVNKTLREVLPRHKLPKNGIQNFLKMKNNYNSRTPAFGERFGVRVHLMN